jgi:hypothetical protein
VRAEQKREVLPLEALSSLSAYGSLGPDAFSCIPKTLWCVMNTAFRLLSAV